MLNNDKVNIVLATYNGELYVAQQIESIINQTYQNWELIIRDDNSTDKTVNILKEKASKDHRITIVADNLGNLGFNNNFLKLLSLTKAKYISICDQDDVWLPQKLELSLKKLRLIETSNRIPSIVHTEARIVDKNLVMIKERFIGSRGGKLSINGILFANCVQGASLVMNDSLKTAAFARTQHLPYDYHFAIVAGFLGKRAFIKEPQLLYRQHGSNIIGALGTNTGGKSEKRFTESFSAVFSRTVKSDQLTLSLQFSLIAYHIIKNNYSHLATTVFDKKRLNDYYYLFEGKSKLKKLWFLIKNQYGFYRKKDLLAFIILIVHGVDLKNPGSW